MALIDLSNFATTLHQASAATFLDGNVFFDPTGNTNKGTISFGDATAYATYTPTAATATTTLGNTAPDQITRATGDFAKDDGWRAGMKVTLASSTTNDGTYTIESISADGLSITTVETTITTESGSGDETLAGAATTNALINLDGLKVEAAYSFENQERRLDETLRIYDRYIAGTFKFGGAYDFVNGRTPETDTDRKLFRGSGWRELTGSVVNRLYFGPKGLGAVDVSSIPYYQSGQYGTSTDFTKLGNIDEAIQVFGDLTNGDFNNTSSSHYFSIRTYGKNYDRVDTLGTLGISELGGYSSGAALNESDHLTTVPATYPLVDVYTTQIAPWDGMTLEQLDAAQVESGFAGANGNFTWILNNTGSGTLNQCVAYLDAIAQADAVVTVGPTSPVSLNGKDYDTWYEYTATGKVRPITGAADGFGVFIEGLTGADKLAVEFKDDNAVVCVYPVYTPVTVELGPNAINDTNAWFHTYIAAEYNTASATEYDDAATVVVKGVADNSSSFITGADTFVSFEHDFTTDGSVNVVFLCEGDGGVTQQKTAITLAVETVSASCVPALENNA